MKPLLVALLLIGPLAHAIPITGTVIGGQILANSDGWIGTFQATGQHSIETGGYLWPSCEPLCDLAKLNRSPVFGGAYLGLSVDSKYDFSSTAGGLVFVPVTFFDVICGKLLTITGQAVPQLGGSALAGDISYGGFDWALFTVPDDLRWNYTAYYKNINPDHADYRLQEITLTAAPVPEPGTLILAFAGLSSLGLFRRFHG